MRDRLFTIIDGEPVITPPLVNIPAGCTIYIACVIIDLIILS